MPEFDFLTLVIAGSSAAISLIAVAVSVAQLHSSVKQGRQQATFDHLLRVRELFRAISGSDPKASRAAALAFYSREVAELSDHAKQYLNLLDALDLIGVAYKHNLVVREIVLAQLRHDLSDPHFVSIAFTDECKTACGSKHIYEDLDLLIKHSIRPSLFVRFTTIGKNWYERAQASTAASAIGAAFARASSRGADSRFPTAALASAKSGAEVGFPSGQPAREDSVSETKPAATPPPPPPPQPSEERGQIPGFQRPPPPPPPARDR